MASPGNPVTTPAELPAVGSRIQQYEEWNKALEAVSQSTGTFVASLRGSPAHPRDIATYLGSLKEAQKKSKLSRTCHAVASCIEAIRRHEKALDMFAQAGGMPGCLAWGCIKFALEVSYGYAKDFERLVDVMADIAKWLEPVAVEAVTFADSEMVSRCLVELYAHIITFWTRCVDFFISPKRSRLYSAFRSIWMDYTSEYESLRTKIDGSTKLLSLMTAAEHHRQFKEFDEKMDRLAVSERHTFLQRDIIHWLSPPEDSTYGNGFHLTELDNICSARFDDACEWIVNDTLYMEWSGSTSNSVLWIESGPGAGKTILASFIITHQLVLADRKCFYYFFKGTDGYRSTPLAAAKCLLSQMYSFCQLKEPTASDNFAALTKAAGEDGHSRCKSFEKAWGLFVSFASSVRNCRVIIDGLDECSEATTFLDSLLQLPDKCSSFVVVTCRSATVNFDRTSAIRVLRLGSGHEDDLQKYIAHRAAHLPARVPPETKASIIQELRHKHKGMFLWVRLVFEELESKITLDELKEALDDLPAELDHMYGRIMRRLDMKLKKAHRRLGKKILTWLYCCQRPLRMEELYEALKYEYREEGFLCRQDEFEDVIKISCGPLVVANAQEVGFVHFTLKQLLGTADSTMDTDSSIPPYFRVQARDAHRQVLDVTLSYMKDMKVAQQLDTMPSWRKSKDRSILDLDLDVTEHMLVEYCAFYWMAHIKATGMTAETFQTLSKFVNTHRSLIWIYLVLTVDDTRLESAFWDLDFLSDTLGAQLTQLPGEKDALTVCQNWCALARYVLVEYGEALKTEPGLLFNIPLSHLATRKRLFPTISWIKADIAGLTCQLLTEAFGGSHSVEVQRRRQLRGNITEPRKLHRRGPSADALGFLHYHAMYDVLLFADYFLTHKPQLFIQSPRTGKQLRPATCEAFTPIKKSTPKSTFTWEPVYVLLDATVSPDKTKVACVYGTRGGYHFFTCVWELQQDIDINRDVPERAWARVVFLDTTYQPIFNGSAGLARFADNNSVWCPAGRVDLRTGATTPFAIELPHLPKKVDELSVGTHGSRSTKSLSLYGTGDFIIFNRTRAWYSYSSVGQRYSSSGVYLGETGTMRRANSSSQGPVNTNILRIDSSGRFVLWINSFNKFYGAELEDTQAATRVRLTRLLDRDHPSKIIFIPEADLAVFSTHKAGRPDLQITTWDLSAMGCPRQVASRSFRDNLCGMCASEDGRVLFLATSNRILSQLSLPDLQHEEEPLALGGDPCQETRLLMTPHGTELGSVLTRPADIQIKVWSLEEDSTREYKYTLQRDVLQFESEVISPDMRWISLGSFDWARLPRSEAHRSDLVPKESRASMRQTISDFVTKTYLPNTPDRIDGRSTHCSPCGHYVLVTRDSTAQWLTSAIQAWSEPDVCAQEEASWKSIEAVGPLDLISESAKISVSFVPGRPWCVLTYWIRSKSDDPGELCDVRCYLLDLEKPVECILARATLSFDSHQQWDFKSAFGGNPAEAWLAQMKEVEHSAQLSHCGGYIVLAATLGGRRWQRVLDLPIAGYETLQSLPVRTTRPRAFGSSRNYWRDHCYWTSIHQQRVLLHRSARSTKDRDTFYSLNVFHQLAVVPARIAEGSAWLVAPESDGQPAKVVVAAAGESAEMMHIRESWEDITGILDGLDEGYRKEMVLMG